MHPTHKPLAYLCSLTLCLVVFGCWPPEPLRPVNTTHDTTSPNQTLPLPTEAIGVRSEKEPATPEDTNSEGESAPQEKTDTVVTQPTSTDKKPATGTEASSSKRPVPKPQPGKTLDLTFDDIKFDIEPDAPFKRNMLPQAIEDLNGQKISIGGYMLPSFQQRDIKQFVLVRDNMECCFGPGAALYDCILIEMDGRGVDFTVRPVVVEGIFTVKEYQDDSGKHLAIYHMQGTGVR
ncbi:hypothetical protein C5Y96_16720 [Blastopirellula marina]|uniref:DUF3299 domain-containing protein n=1 Tax=Blastopirellula marina TaxID=124 RepID=A0A2S8F797_9BACT|nr:MULTISPECIES: DUF3299 domain-containing protein [Pirellulaceae]PQO28018.1 hypothetical protein C5Y96_16720 [Blastopirellula marina]RCS48443.1 DUF3299 domain-containing protein [Bremerella cremea]